MATDSNRMAIRATGYWTLSYSRWRIWARHRFTWPFGSIEVREDRLILGVHNPFGRLLALLSQWSRHPVPLIIPLDAIDHLRAKRGRVGRAKIVSSDPVFDLVTFGGFPPAFEIVDDRLRTLGVSIVEASTGDDFTETQ